MIFPSNLLIGGIIGVWLYSLFWNEYLKLYPECNTCPITTANSKIKYMYVPRTEKHPIVCQEFANKINYIQVSSFSKRRSSSKLNTNAARKRNKSKLADWTNIFPRARTSSQNRPYPVCCWPSDWFRRSGTLHHRLISILFSTRCSLR